MLDNNNDDGDIFVYTGEEGQRIPKDVTHVRVPNGVTTIRARAFYGRSDLISVCLSASVQRIEFAAFCHCTSLAWIIFPKDDEGSLEEIGGHAFYCCESLTALKLPTTVRGIGPRAFYGCRSLVSMDLREGIRQIAQQAFLDCASLKHIKIPSTTKKIGNETFYRCHSLESVELSEGIEEIGHAAFGMCKSLRNLRLPSTVERIGRRAFCACKNLQAIELPVGLKEVGRRGFHRCNAIKSVRFYVRGNRYFELTCHGNALEHDDNRELVLKGARSKEKLGVFQAAHTLVCEALLPKYFAMFLERCASEPDAIFYFLSRKNAELLYEAATFVPKQNKRKLEQI